MFSKCAGEAECGAGGGAAGGAGGAGAGRVSSWSLGLRQLLSDSAGCASFSAFLDKERSKENIDFWLECERYRREGGAELAQQIWRRFLDEQARESVNLDAQVRQQLQQRLPQAPQDLFEKAQNQIFRLMEFDSYKRFLKSQEHSECARAELQGEPLPRSNTPKLKKSRSNADERGRGVLSILRTQSRDRPPPGVNKPNQEDAPRRPSISLDRLCRVVLPDSATSVQQTADRLTIKQSIDNMLRNRGIHCPHYDVVVKGENKPVELDRPMSTLAGREVVVTRRERVVTLRLSFAGRRSLLARSLPGKTLADVVESARLYQQCGGGRVRVTRAGQPVALDTKVEELENEKLQVHIMSDAAAEEAGEGGSVSVCVAPPAHAHTHSLDEITNRVFEEVLHGKAQLPSADNSMKSESCSCRSSGGSVLARLRPGDPVLTTNNKNNNNNTNNTEETASSSASPPVPAVRSFVRPRPAVRTSLARPAPAPAPADPPPLPPKPRVLPAKPPNWGHSTDHLNRIACLDQPASSFV